MLLQLDIVDPKPLTEIEVKCIVVAFFTKAMMAGLAIPDKLTVRTVSKFPQKHKLAECNLYSDGYNEIVLAIEGLTKADIIDSLFHELGHAVRIASQLNHQDNQTEELENRALIFSFAVAVEWLINILLADSHNSLKPIAHENTSSDLPAGALVRQHDPQPVV